MRIKPESLTAWIRAKLTGTYPVLINKIEDGKITGELFAFITSLSEKLTKFDNEAEKINNSETLNDTGKAEAYEELKKKTLPVILGLPKKDYADLAESTYSKIDKSILGSKPQKDEVLEFLKLQEVRTRLQGESTTKLQKRYIAAIQSGEDKTFLKALESDPMPYPFVTPETIAASRAAKMVKTFPYLTEEARNYEAAASIVNNIMNETRGSFAPSSPYDTRKGFDHRHHNIGTTVDLVKEIFPG